MQSVCSFNVRRIGKRFVVEVRGFSGIDRLFQFDTGASVSLIGLDTVCESPESQNRLLKILEEEIKEQDIQKDAVSAQTVTNEEVTVYPCVCRGIRIQGTAPIDFYFHIYLGKIRLPLIGFDYIDDCMFHHNINGDTNILAVAENVGKRFYRQKVIDFNHVMELLNKEESGSNA